MKKIFIISIVLIARVFASAQTAVILHHAGSVSAFYGNAGFQDAYAAAVSGDTLYLPGGYFYPPNPMDKGLKIFGAGHHPDSTLATLPTTILSSISIGENADNLHMEGLVVSGDMATTWNAAVHNVTFRRVAFNSLSFSGDRTNPCLNGMIDQCIVYATLSLDNTAYCTVKCSIINNGVMNLYNSVFTNCILLAAGRSIHYAGSSVIRNNVFYGSVPDFYQSTNNQVQHNLFTTTPDLSGNSASGNYFNVLQANVFVNYGNDGFKYSYNFHLKTPASYPGADATQVGVYGTSLPFKEGSVPVNPHIQTKSIAEQTNAEGKIPVQIKVAAQNN